MRKFMHWIDDFAPLATFFMALALFIGARTEEAVFMVLAALFMLLWDIRKLAIMEPRL